MTGPSLPLFVLGPPRSGTTIVAQSLNAHAQIKLYDEVNFVDVLEFGEAVVGKLRAFLMQRGCYESYCAEARASGDPAGALNHVMSADVAPRLIWGEKNPMYAIRLDALRRCFPGGLFLFVLRDPRDVVNSYLIHRASPYRSSQDFWIKDTVSEALALVESCLAPLLLEPGDLTVLRYEHFIARPKASLEAIVAPWGLRFEDQAMAAPHDAPDTVGDHQFFRRGSPLPWKLDNLRPLQTDGLAKDRLDPQDPAWSAVEALARRFNYL